MEQIVLDKQNELNISQLKSFTVKKMWREAITAIILCKKLIKHCQIYRLPNQKRRQSYESKHIVMTALFCASEEGNVSGLEELALLTNIDFNMANELGETAMHIAAGYGQLEVVRFLQMKGAKVTVLDKHGDSPLIWAARHGHYLVVDHLSREGLKLDQQNKCLETALHIAARYGNQAVVERLCAFGATSDLPDEHSETPLHIACWHGYDSVLKILCHTKPNLNAGNKDQETALHCAAARGHLECVSTLVDAGASVDLQDQYGQSPLFHAIRRNQLEIALFLLHSKCALDITDGAGDSGLHYAANEGSLTIVQALCALGCNVDIANQVGRTALHCAAKEGHIEVVRVLCLAGCNVGAKNKDGLTAEIIAFAQGFSAVGELLGRLKNDQQKDMYIEQLCPGTQPLRRIKLKVFGHCSSGKTTILSTLQTSFIGSFFRRRSDSSGNRDHQSERQPVHKNKVKSPSHEHYTRGIDVHNVTISGVGELSTWEFSGYETYRQLYDHFVGNTDCVHMILFNLCDAQETQYSQVLYWMNFLKARIMPTEPIGHGGCSSKPAHVILVGTHADQVSPPLNRNVDGEWFSHETEAMLQTIQHRFQADFAIHSKLLLIDTNQTSAGQIKSLKTYLQQTKARLVENLPKSTGFLDACVSYLSNLRKQQQSFPVTSWPVLMDNVRTSVNPLAGEAHCQQMVQQLQLMGEVIYLKADLQNSDLVVVTPQWLCHEVIGWLLSAEYLQTVRVTGCYTADEMQLVFPDVISADDLMQVLDAMSMCSICEMEIADPDDPVDLNSPIEYEFPAFNFMESPLGIWDKPEPGVQFVYGGVRLQAPHGMQRSLDYIIPRIQVQLRRSMREFQDPMDAELCQWQFCTKLSSTHMEGLVTYIADTNKPTNRCESGSDTDRNNEQYSSGKQGREAIEVNVRGPSDLASSCFYLMEDLANIVEQTIAEISPGLPLERHFLSPKDLAKFNQFPFSYDPQDVLETQLQRRKMIRSGAASASSMNGSVNGHPDNIDFEQEEPFVDVICFGSKEAAYSLTLGVDLHISQLPLHARRELASLLDPPDGLGRDWSILAVTLGLGEQLPEVDSAGPVVSRTDQILAAWALSDPPPTIGLLCFKLRELGRKDAVDAISKCVSLYLLAAPIEDIALQTDLLHSKENGRSNASEDHSDRVTTHSTTLASPMHDSGVVSQNSTSVASQRSNSSTLSR